MVESESRRKLNKPRLDALSIPNNVIKTGRSHGARHGKTEEQKEHHMAWNAWKRCCKKVDSQGELFTVFTIDSSEIQFVVNLNSQSDGQNKCKEWDELAKDDHTYKLPLEEKRSYQEQWYFILNKAGKNGLMKLRSDCRAPVMMKNRLHHESGEPI